MKFWYNPTFLAIFSLVILSLPALKSLNTPGFYTSHDGEAHVARMAQYYQALKDGQFPPRIAGSFYNGVGSPIFTYIYPLPYFFGSIIHFANISFIDSFKLLMSTGFILSAIFMFIWLKEVFNNEKAAFVGALFYVWVPYRFLLIYVRGSVSELLAYTFLPLALFFLVKDTSQNKMIWKAAGAISLSLVLLSHNLVGLMAIMLVLSYMAVLALFHKSPKSLMNGLVIFFWGVAISSFIYIPGILERSYIKLNEIVKIAYPNHFVSVEQLLHSPWGYGFDLAGFENDQMSFQIGLAHLLTISLAVLLIAHHLYTRTRKMNKLDLKSATLFIVVFAASIVLMVESPVAIFIWENFKPIQIVDIPWRFLGISAVASAFLAAFVVHNIRLGIFAIILVVAVLVANRNHLRLNQTINFDDVYFLNYYDTASQYGEFTPIWRTFISAPRSIDPKTQAQVITGNANIETLKNTSDEVALSLDVLSEEAKIRINKIYFPGVKVYLDQRRLEPFADLIIKEQSPVAGTDAENDGLMLINSAKGRHKIEIFYGETAIRLFANYLSLSSFAFAVFVIAKNLNVKVAKS